jgi:hypothetical protein
MDLDQTTQALSGNKVPVTRLTLRQNAIDRLAGQASGRSRPVRERERESAGDRSERPTGVVHTCPTRTSTGSSRRGAGSRFPSSSIPPGGENRRALAADIAVTWLAGGPAVMSTETLAETSIVDVSALPPGPQGGSDADQ